MKSTIKNKFLHLLFFLLLLHFQTNANTVDSLKQKLAAEKIDSVKVNLMLDIAFEFQMNGAVSSKDSMRAYTNSATQLAEKIEYKPGLARALFMCGTLEVSYENNLAKGTTYMLKSLKIYEELADSSRIASCYMQLGVISYLLKYYEDAIINLKQAMSFAKKMQYINGTSNYLIALSSLELDSFNLAKKYFLNALEIYNANGNVQGTLECHTYMGKMFIKQNNADSAFFYLQKALGESNSQIDKQTISRTKAFLSTAYLLVSDFKNAIVFAEDAFAVGSEYNDEITIMESASTLYKAYQQKADYKKSNYYLTELKHLEDSVYNTNTAQRVAEMKSKFEFEKQLDYEKVKRDRQESLQQATLQQQKIIRNFFIAGFILVLIVSSVLLFQYRAKQRANTQLSISLTDLKNAQTQLVQAEKLASLGQLTAGIAHEIKNPLNFVNNFSELATEMIDELIAAKNEKEKNEIGGYVKLNLEKIAQHGKRANQIVQSMLMHSHVKQGERQLTDINKLCEEFSSLAITGMKATQDAINCEFVKSLDNSLPLASIIPQEISRVIINIMNNAFYAVKQKSLLSPEFMPVVSLTTQKLPKFISIQIKDNGEGISQKNIDKIFEPFFTTKPAGDGTGLGLSICYDIVKKHGGDIKVTSKEKEFTAFTILLPV